MNHTTTERASKRLSIDTLSSALERICFSHGKTMNAPLLELWQEVLGDLTEKEFIGALREYSVGASCQFWPQPGQIYRLARPEGNKAGEALLMAEAILRTIGTCGADASGVKRAEEKLPGLAWAFIQNVGGWAKFLRDMQDDNVRLDNLRAHMRDSIMTLMDRKKSGKPLLLGNEKTGLTSLSEQLKASLPQFPQGDDEGVK